jgi:anti-anti-sigma factor
MAFSGSLFDRLNQGKSGVTANGAPLTGDSAAVLVTVAGYVETMNAVHFQSAMLEMMLESPEIRGFVFDIENVTYLSSAGIGAFMTILSRSKETGQSVRLRGVSKRMEELFRQLGCWDMFEAPQDDQRASPEGRGAPGTFPARIQCPSCGTRLRIDKAGSFRCPSCRTGFSADAGGCRPRGAE